MADTIAGAEEVQEGDGACNVDVCDSEDFFAAMVPEGTSQWMEGDSIFNGFLRKRALQYHFQQYLKKRDMKQIYANEPIRWTRYCTPLLASLNKTKIKSPRHLARQSKHLFDWMVHAANLSKGATPYTRLSASTCKFCGVPETQQHINVACTHPALVETRRTFRRAIDEFFLCYRHQNLPTMDRWIAPLIDHMESTIWQDTQASDDLWNGRWTEETLQSLLQDNATYRITQRHVVTTLKWLQQLTNLLQRTQKAIYSTRQMELLSLEAKNRRTTEIALVGHKHCLQHGGSLIQRRILIADDE
jgi:hypothetical protein